MAKQQIEKLDFNRVKHEDKNFTTHLNIILQNLRNHEALGIWCYLSSLPPNWKVNKDHLRKHFNIGRDRLDKGLSVLKSVKLIDIQRERFEDGTLGDGVIFVKVGYDFILDTEFQCSGAEAPSNLHSHLSTEKPDAGFPVTGKQQLYNKLIKIKQIKQKKEALSVDNFVMSEEQKELCRKKGVDYLETFNKFMSYYEGRRFVMSTWIRRFDKWVKDEKPPSPKRRNKIRSTIKEWGPGHPDYDRQKTRN